MNMCIRGKVGRSLMTALVVASLALSPSLLLGQSRFKVQSKDKTDKPISQDLLGSFIELGFGRSDLLWGEMLFDGDFELTKPLGEKIAWLRYSRKTKEQEDWWHTGYEEQKWYLVKEGVKNDTFRRYHNNFWPSGHGKYFVVLDNTKGTGKLTLAQDRIYIRKGIAYHFEGLLSSGYQLSENKYSNHTLPLSIVLYKEGDLSTPLSTTKIDVKTNQLNMHKATIAPIDYEGWCTFAIEIPAKSRGAVDLLSLMASDNINGWRKEAIEILRDDLKLKSIRFPGGCFASLYDWKDGVGPRESRPVDYNGWWNNEVVNDIGTVEFVDFCNEIGANPFLCVPLMFSNPYDAAEWVSFCNDPNDKRRIGYGRKEPLNVKYWELDNETYRRMDAITYANKAVEFSKAMKAVDPTIKIAMGNYWLFNRKFKEMLDIAGAHIDIVTNRGGDHQEMLNDIKILNAYNAKHNRSIVLSHTEFRSPLSRGEKGVDGLNRIDNQDKETMFNRSVRWDYAMSVVSKLIEFQNMGEMFYTAHYTNLSDGWGENLINVAKEKSYLSASGVAYALFSKLDIAHPLIVKGDDPTGNILIQVAQNSKRDKLTVIVLNYSSKDVTCEVDLSAIKPSFNQQAKLYTIIPESKYSFNSTANPDHVKIETSHATVSEKLNLTLKPTSMYVYEIDMK